MNLVAIQNEITRLTILGMLIEVVAFVLVMWALYHVIKAAVKHAIEESGLIEAKTGWRGTVNKYRKSSTD